MKNWKYVIFNGWEISMSYRYIDIVMKKISILIFICKYRHPYNTVWFLLVCGFHRAPNYRHWIIFWGDFQNKVYVMVVANLEELKRRITEESARINTAMLKHMFSYLMKCSKACKQATLSYFQHLLYFSTSIHVFSYFLDFLDFFFHYVTCVNFETLCIILKHSQHLKKIFFLCFFEKITFFAHRYFHKNKILCNFCAKIIILHFIFLM